MRRVLSLGATLLLAFLVFLPTIRYELVYDDFTQIVENPRITSWSYVPGYFTTHLWVHDPLDPAYYYRPLFLLWLRLTDATLGPPGAMWHWASILAHLGVTVSVFLLIRRLTGNWNGALLAAGLFAIHPIHTEAVAWVSSVSEPLLTAFLVLCVYFYAQRKSPISFVSLLFAALAMLTKETGIIALALIFTYEWTQSNFKRAIAGAAPYLIPSLLFLAMRMNALGKFSPGVPANMSVSDMVLTWPRVLAVYAAHLIWPVHLSLCYDVPIETAIWPLMVLFVVTAGLIWAVRGRDANVRFGAAWFAITLIPALAIRYLFENDYVHDRYLYLPSVGLAIIAGVWFSKLRFTAPRIVAACAIALALCWGTRSDLRIWQDETSLFRRAVETAPQNPFAMNNLADAYLTTHHEAEALPLLERVIAMRPDDRQGYLNMSRYYRQTGNYTEAARYLAIFQQRYYAEQAASGAR
jgi:tetratricopeptide (TPR) repeat protein